MFIFRYSYSSRSKSTLRARSKSTFGSTPRAKPCQDQRLLLNLDQMLRLSLALSLSLQSSLVDLCPGLWKISQHFLTPYKTHDSLYKIAGV